MKTREKILVAMLGASFIALLGVALLGCSGGKDNVSKVSDVTSTSGGDAKVPETVKPAEADGGVPNEPSTSGSSEFFDESLGIHAVVPAGWSVQKNPGVRASFRRPDEPMGSGSIEVIVAKIPRDSETIDWSEAEATEIAGQPARFFEAPGGPNLGLLYRFDHEQELGWYVEAYIRSPESNQALADRRTEVESFLHTLRQEGR